MPGPGQGTEDCVGQWLDGDEVVVAALIVELHRRKQQEQIKEKSSEPTAKRWATTQEHADPWEQTAPELK